jgi:hypothetical protein
MDQNKREIKSYPHNNKTGRWISTFRPEFDPKHPHAFWLGSMTNNPRRFELHVAFNEATAVEEIVSGNKRKLPKPSKHLGDFGLHPCMEVTSDNLSSICSRYCIHPTRDVIAGANSSGKVNIFR